ncbi:MAG: hypothetical protein ACRELB_17395, partial [Polyangiaceae bacterium]
MYVVRYSEIGLKGRNRGFFEEQLVRNLARRLHGAGDAKVERIRGRILVTHASEAAREIGEQIADTPGVRSFSLAHRVERDLAAIEAKSVELARARLADTPGTTFFGVATDRVDKTFPLISSAVSARVGAAVL